MDDSDRPRSSTAPDSARARPASVPALPLPGTGPDAAVDWIETHLAGLTGDASPPSPRFRGGQTAADAALASCDVRGYAARRNEVWPRERRGASALSPYIRHGLLPLQRVWDHVEDAPARDARKFRDELLWQEYARHLYARVGPRMRTPLRFETPAEEGARWEDPWPARMACVSRLVEELRTDGWLVNQTRMWLASQWTVRAAADWREGEDRFFRELLDGSRAANRLGWQWTVGTATGKAYGFSRAQVEKRAPGWCRACVLASSCPIQDWPRNDAATAAPDRPAALGRVAETETGGGPRVPERKRTPEAVWLTAESLGDADPALAAHPELPALFVFDVPRLARWRLSRKRLAFLVETLADLGTRRELSVWAGDPAERLAGRSLAASHTPVPGWRALATRLDLAEIHPWPWLERPHAGPIGSYSAWRKGLGSARGPEQSARSSREPHPE